mgnify:CR=1 FL=1
MSGEMGIDLESTRELLQFSLARFVWASCFGLGDVVKEIGERSEVSVQDGDGVLVDGDCITANHAEVICLEYPCLLWP